jgi:CspA family cold shock protein
MEQARDASSQTIGQSPSIRASNLLYRHYNIAQGTQAVAKGVVKWFNDRKGFGMIQPYDGGPDVFVHYTAILGNGHRTLTEGDVVEFEIVANARGRQAEKVILVSRGG